MMQGFFLSFSQLTAHITSWNFIAHFIEALRFCPAHKTNAERERETAFFFQIYSRLDTFLSLALCLVA